MYGLSSPSEVPSELNQYMWLSTIDYKLKNGTQDDDRWSVAMPNDAAYYKLLVQHLFKFHNITTEDEFNLEMSKLHSSAVGMGYDPATYESTSECNGADGKPLKPEAGECAGACNAYYTSAEDTEGTCRPWRKMYTTLIKPTPYSGEGMSTSANYTFRPCLASPALGNSSDNYDASCQYSEEPTYKYVENWRQNAWGPAGVVPDPAKSGIFPWTGMAWTFNWAMWRDLIIANNQEILTDQQGIKDQGAMGFLEIVIRNQTNITWDVHPDFQESKHSRDNGRFPIEVALATCGTDASSCGPEWATFIKSQVSANEKLMVI